MISSTLQKLINRHYKKSFPKKRFIPGQSAVPVSGKVFDGNELLNGVTAVLDGWWTEGEFAEKFETEFCNFLDVSHTTLVNSGSSANLLALTSLTSTVFGKRALTPGDEVITVACGFPTTVNPIIQTGCRPVFIDVDLRTKNAIPAQIEKAISAKTRAIMMAHTLGNPMPLETILLLVKKYNLWFVEDCCDALGGTYAGKKLGTFGHVATFSFYPAHQITMGEGGAVVTNSPIIHRSIRQFRDWGRDCWCDTGKDNSCKKRFTWQLGDLPLGYDHKYTYSQIGFNLKLTDIQAAIGVAQLKKLPSFVKARQKNFRELSAHLSGYGNYFIFSESLPQTSVSWFGFMIVVSDGAPFTKNELVAYLEDHRIGTRSLFGGNLLKHPAYKGRSDMRVVGNLANADKIMKDGFWIGVYPGISKEMMMYVKQCFVDFLKPYEKNRQK